MAPSYFHLNLFFSGFLFVSTASLLEYCEFISIPLEKEWVSTKTTIIQNQSVAHCYTFSFSSSSKFSENEQRHVEISMQLIGNKCEEYHTRIEYIKNHQLKILRRSIKCDVISGTGEFHAEFIFNVEFGYNVSFENVPKSIIFRILLDDHNRNHTEDKLLDKTFTEERTFVDIDGNSDEKMFMRDEFLRYNVKSFDEASSVDGSGDISNQPTVSTTTVMIPTELASEPTPYQEELMWKLISLVFIVLTTFLLILSICLWRALPSFKSAQVLQERSGVSMQPPRPTEEVAN